MADQLALQEQLTALPEEEHASLASVLLHSLDGPQYDVSNAEVHQRRQELENGQVAEISHEELISGIRRSKGQ